MSIEEKYKKKNKEIQQDIKLEMEDIKNGLKKENQEQLITILKELEKILNTKCLPLNYPRIIIDSWDFNDELGMKLLDLAELYKRWK